MGIISETVEVKLNQSNVKYYENLEYKIPIKKCSKSTYYHTGKEFVYDFDKSILVKVEDLSNGSHAIIEVLCDMCEKML